MSVEGTGGRSMDKALVEFVDKEGTCGMSVDKEGTCGISVDNEDTGEMSVD